MKCYYTHPKVEEKVLIPICWTVVMSQDISDCTCEINPHIAYINQLKNDGKIEEMKAYREIYNEQKKKYK